MRSGSRYSAMLLVQVLAVVQGHSLATESLLCEAELLSNSTGVSCNATRDTIGTCWPHSPAGMMVLLPCPESFNGLRYDSSKSVFRECLASGMWAQRSNYSFCLPIIESKKNSYYYNVAQIINYVGHCISLIALVMAFVIFWCLRSIRCLRNTIHWNFVTTFILRNTMYFLLPLIDVNTQLANEIWCRIVITVFNYFQVTNFFWMFVEGCYLHTVIVMTYSTDKLRKWLFLCLGWGIPVLIITIWALMKQHYENKECWFGENTGTYKYIDYIYQGPIILVLLVNFVFLFNIVRILMTKLRASKTSETIQYRKAVKATLVLLPLLGITYILYFVNFGRDEASNIIFVYVNSFLMSFQGFFISVFYCFLNGEVRMAIRKRWNHWMDNQSIRTRVSRAMSIPTSPTRMSIHSLKRNTSV